MDNVDPISAAKVLATSAWRRDFEQDPELQKAAHAQEVARVVAALKEELGELPGILHDEHALELNPDERGLTLFEGERRQSLARCHINSANTGQLIFQYMSGGLAEEAKQELRLVRIWRDQYGWVYGSKILSSNEVARLCLARLLGYANSIVARDLRLNPKPTTE